MSDQRFSDNDVSKRDIPSFIEPRPPLIQNPFMRPRPQKGTNLLELFEDSEIEDAEFPDLVQVYLRLKPCKVPNTLYEVRTDKCLVTSLDTATAGHGRRTQHNVSKMYTFSKIFGPECKQKEIFEAVVKDNLKKLPEGHNFTLLTYGASGSGKTYTLMGTVGAPGLVPRSLEYVFRLVDAAQQPAYKPAEGGADKLNFAEQDYELQWVKRLRHVSAPLRDKYRRMSAQLHADLTASTVDLSNRLKHYVWVSFVEIYNEAIYDLLAPPDKRTKLRIREDSTGNVYIKDVTQAFVRSGEEAYDVMVAGKHNLVVAATGVHANSSRSHCIFTITMLTETEGGRVRAASVRLCDLAGSERARATRNTGARMAESRAINASLHVLERCLHTLRRKQRAGRDALVPYRESKLTRLLGSGLSGAHGEAVSMVVTLNTSPEYAHETKHVLSLAAVAQDIQINNTVLYGSTLESSTQDTTITSGAEIMKLRSDNERLHFELVQAQARNRELLAAMEEKQQEAADTMRELVEEAKDMTRQYYESQMEALQAEMDEMREEYESKLEQFKAPPSSNTPTKSLQAKITQLMTEIAVLEEKLTAESLARSRAEKEVQYLQTCIEERDEKEKDHTPVVDVMDLTDSEHESDEEDEDPLNESLEPTFRKELNGTIAIQEQQHSDNETVNTINKDESELEQSNDTIQNYDNVPINSPHASDVHEMSATNEKINNMESFEDAQDEKSLSEIIINKANNTTFENNYPETCKFDKMESFEDAQNEKSMSEIIITEANNYPEHCKFDKTCEESFKSTKIESRGTYFVKDTEIYKINNHEETKLMKINMFRGTYCVQDPVEDVSKINSCNDISSLIEPSSQEYEDVPTRTNDMIEIIAPQKKEHDAETLVSKIIRPLSNQGTDNSLTQFEKLEKASEEYQDEINQNQTVFGNIRILKEKKKYFDDVLTKESLTTKVSNDVSTLKINKEKRTFFDYKEVNVEPTSNNKKFDNERSPIVKDVVNDQFEPSTIKKILGEPENISKPDVISHHKPKFTKKHDSVDIFDSPALAIKIQEKVENVVDNVEIARASIEKLVLEQQSKKSTKPNELKAYIEEHMLTEQVMCAAKILEESRPVIGSEVSLGALIQNNKLVKVTLPQNEELNDVDLENNSKLESMSSVEDPHEIQTKIKTEIKIEHPSVDGSNLTVNETQNITKSNNTIEEFENIYQDLTAPRATEFEILVSQNPENNESIKSDGKNEEIKHDRPNANIECRIEQNINNLVEGIESKIQETDANEETKYNLRNKRAVTTTKKRSLRLRRRKDETDEDTSQEMSAGVDKQFKLKDIGNLQCEFSDVTMDVPASKKELQDIPSPEKCDNENLPPMMGIQSCPSKSVTRSRRKLFTPRVEPLEESLGETGGSTERVYVPRPSYHRPRARRKL